MRGFLARKLEGYFDIAARVKAGNGTSGRSQVVVLGVNFVVDVGIEAAEAVSSGIVGDASDDRLRPHIQEIDDAGRNGIIVLIDCGAVNGAELGFRFLILRTGCRNQSQPNDRQEHQPQQFAHGS